MYFLAFVMLSAFCVLTHCVSYFYLFFGADGSE